MYRRAGNLRVNDAIYMWNKEYRIAEIALFSDECDFGEDYRFTIKEISAKMETPEETIFVMSDDYFKIP